MAARLQNSGLRSFALPARILLRIARGPVRAKNDLDRLQHIKISPIPRRPRFDVTTPCAYINTRRVTMIIHRYRACRSSSETATSGCSGGGHRRKGCHSIFPAGPWVKIPQATQIVSLADLTSIFTASLAEWSKHKAPRLGASLAFYTLLSMARLLLVLASIIGLILGQQRPQADIISQVQATVCNKSVKR